MALSILKMVGSGTTEAKPTVTKYFHTLAAAFNTSESYSIAVADFKTDTGGDAAALTLAANNNGYYTLFINGVVQPSGLIKSVAIDKLKIGLTAGAGNLSLLASEVITLEVTNFAPTTTFAG